MLEHERKAVGLYAILARDWSDFIDMANDADDLTLETLNLMLTTLNPKHDADTVELNRLGAGVVANIIEGRKAA